MQLTINGEPREAAPELTVLTLLEQIGLNPGKVAVERNREIVPRSRYGETALAEGDRLEIVQFVGGG
jgi:thiamine biosynthesis protein ThiS